MDTQYLLDYILDSHCFLEDQKSQSFAHSYRDLVTMDIDALIIFGLFETTVIKHCEQCFEPGFDTIHEILD